MFYIGSNVMSWPLQAQRAITDGMFSPFITGSPSHSLIVIYDFVGKGHEVCVREFTLPSGESTD